MNQVSKIDLIEGICDAFETALYFLENTEYLNLLLKKEIQENKTDYDKFEYKNSERFRFINSMMYSFFTSYVLLIHSLIIGFTDKRTKLEVDISLAKFKELFSINDSVIYEQIRSDFKGSALSKFRNKLFAHNDIRISDNGKVPSTHLRLLIKIDELHIKTAREYANRFSTLLHSEFKEEYTNHCSFPKSYIKELF